MPSASDLPLEVLNVFCAHGVKSDRILAIFRFDRDKSGAPCDGYVAVTDSELSVLCGVMAIVKKKTTLFTTLRTVPIVSKFTEISFEQYPLDTLTDIALEERIYGCRITADTSSGPLLIACASGACKETLTRFTRHLRDQLRGRPVTWEDNADESVCPKCGKPYPDPRRRICPKCMDKRKLIKRLSVFFLKYTPSLVVLLLLLISLSALGVLSPYIGSAFYYDEVLDRNGSFYGQILLVLSMIVGMRLFSVLLNVVNGVISGRIAAHVTYDLKKTIFNAIHRLSLGFFNSRQTGGLMTQINSDAQTIHQFFVNGLTHVLVNGVQILALIGVMFWFSPWLTLFSLLTVPPFFLLIRFCHRRLHKLHAKRFSSSRSMSSVLSDILSGMRVVKAFSQEKQEINRFNKQSTRLAHEDENLSTFQTHAFPLVNFLLQIGGSLVWAVGGWMVLQGKLTYGLLLGFVAYLNLIHAPLQSFASITSMFTDCMNACSRLFEIMDAVPDVIESEHPVTLDHMDGAVSFRDVEFSYEKNRKVIDGISFEIEAGKTIGIVGHTGAGKSTLANLLIRLYDVSAGQICIDGVDIRDISFESLRRQVAIVSQETYIFTGTILDNIRYARPEATHDEVLTAARIAGAHSFIMGLPDGYQTMVGAGYKTLSGGERQRISIARAVLRDPRILILDEATSAMDTETERQIHEALNRLSHGRTTIMIAHRLSTLRNADKLVVIDRGKMPESGTHAELMAQKGVYHTLYRMQAEALKNIGIETWKGEDTPCHSIPNGGPPMRRRPH